MRGDGRERRGEKNKGRGGQAGGRAGGQEGAGSVSLGHTRKLRLDTDPPRSGARELESQRTKVLSKRPAFFSPAAAGAGDSGASAAGAAGPFSSTTSGCWWPEDSTVLDGADADMAGGVSELATLAESKLSRSRSERGKEAKGKSKPLRTPARARMPQTKAENAGWRARKNTRRGRTLGLESTALASKTLRDQRSCES